MPLIIIWFGIGMLKIIVVFKITVVVIIQYRSGQKLDLVWLGWPNRSG